MLNQMGGTSLLTNSDGTANRCHLLRDSAMTAVDPDDCRLSPNLTSRKNCWSPAVVVGQMPDLLNVVFSLLFFLCESEMSSSE